MIQFHLLTIIWLVFTLNMAPPLVAAATREATKNAPIKTETRKGPTTEEEIIASFEVMIKKYQQFFNEPRLCYNKQKFSESPTGFTYAAAKYIAKGDTSYDVKKTDSLISPYTGHILMMLQSWTANKCGNIKITLPHLGTKSYGFDTLEAAKQAALNDSCFESETPEEIRFNFAFQRGKWNWKSAIRTKYNNPPIYISTALGDGVEVGYPLEDNRDWLILLEQ